MARARRQDQPDRAGDRLPEFVEPMLATLQKRAPEGQQWLNEVKFDGYRLHARLQHGEVRLLTRTGVDWTVRYPRIAEAVAGLPAEAAYLDGELVALREDGTSDFEALQRARKTSALVFYAFDLLFLDGRDFREMPLLDRKAALQGLLDGVPPPIAYSEHHQGQAGELHEAACRMGLEGIVSKTADGPYRSGRRETWVKTKCFNRQEFVVAGWTGSGRFADSLLLAVYDDGGRLNYAGRVGVPSLKLQKELGERLQPLSCPESLRTRPPPRTSRFGPPVDVARVNWVAPNVVVEARYLTWPDGGVLRHATLVGVRDDKAARDVRRTA